MLCKLQNPLHVSITLLNHSKRSLKLFLCEAFSDMPSVMSHSSELRHHCLCLFTQYWSTQMIYSMSRDVFSIVKYISIFISSLNFSSYILRLTRHEKKKALW